LRFYNKRGTAEQWIKESKQAVAMTRLSCHRFRANEVRLWLSLIAYNLGNFWRRLVKIGGRLIQYARYYWLLLAESHLPRQLFACMLRKNGATVADGIVRAQSGADFGDETGRQKDKCLMTRSVKRRYQLLYANAR
jgi:hypothetical protein